MSTQPSPGALPAGDDRPRLLVDEAAVGRNVRTIARAAGAPVLAVVKADGFGCGAVAVARAALRAGAVALGTATLDEAVALRRAGFAAPLLCWVLPVDADWDTALRLRIEPCVASTDHLLRLAAAARSAGVVARVHLHADTGMARDGAPAAEWRRLVRAAAEARDAVVVAGVMGHLPTADDPSHAANDDGVALFLAAVDAVRAEGLDPGARHLAATEAALRLHGAGFDLVRIGGGLPGIGPGLEPAATLTAPVVLTRHAVAGTPVGYGHEAVTDRDTVLATLPLGYADGIPRRAVPGASVLLGGRRRPLVGRVSMDQVVVDAGPEGVPLGASAVVFGPGAAGEPTLAEWAAWAGTIERDVLTGIGARVERTVV